MLGELTGTQIGTVGPEPNRPSICRNSDHFSILETEFARETACGALRSGFEANKLSGDREVIAK